MAVWLGLLAAGCSGNNTEKHTEVVLFELNSIQGVSNNPTAKTVFTLTDKAHITKLLTYHWNGGAGATPGTLSLRNTQTSERFGPWTVVGLKNGWDAKPGSVWPTASNGPPFLYWTAQPGADLPAGEYEIVDSDPSTWSYASDTQGRGIALVYGWLASTTSTVPRGGVTGTISTGTPVSLASTSIPAGGGTVVVQKPGDVLDGLTVTVPANSYAAPKTFSVSAAPVTGHTFGSDFNPLTPLITVENGGDVAADIMTIKIPAKVTDGRFAMAFFYDPVAQKLEGMATVAQDATSITVATRHFTSFILSEIDKALLKKDIDTAFRPGIDDWQFVNWGSYIAPGGHCTGQSMTAMWYFYEQPDGKDLTLYGRYDHNGLPPATSSLWYDDSFGYRFASVVWSDMDWASWSRRLTERFIADVDADTWRLFAYSMQLTRQPQMAEVWDTVKGGGHAIVVYRMLGGNLYVADPNMPGATSQKIDYAAEKFAPYKSGASAEEIDAGNYSAYDRITYVAKDALSDWKQLRVRWNEFKAGTIGNDKFPGVKMTRFTDAGQVDLVDGATVSDPSITFGVARTSGNVTSVQWTAYRDQAVVTPTSPGTYALTPGANVFGFYLEGQGPGVSKWRYIDFKTFTVNYAQNTATVNIEGTWNPCATTAGLCNQWEFNGGSGTWTHGGFQVADSLKNHFTYTLKGDTLDLSGLSGYDYGDQAPYKVTVSGTTMTWTSINISTATPRTFKR